MAAQKQRSTMYGGLDFRADDILSFPVHKILGPPRTAQIPGAGSTEEPDDRMEEHRYWVALRPKFASRKIWSRNALCDHLKAQAFGEINDIVMRRALFKMAYYFGNGPFRILWIENGFDPRHDPANRIYQLLDFRVPGSWVEGARKGEVLWSDICTFKVQPDRRQLFLQLCDIGDDRVQAIITQEPNAGTCNENTGWFDLATLHQLRQIVRTRLHALLPQMSKAPLVHPRAPRRAGPGRRPAAARAVVAPEPTAPPLMLFTSQDRVDVLSEALPFIQRFQGKIVVVKYGGAAMKDPTLKDRVIKDLVLLSCVGLRPVLVHGGGPEINTWLTKIGIEPQFRNGLRVTDGPTMEVVEMVLVGKVNKSLVSLINRAGGSSVGMCGKDAKLITARPTSLDLGFVGEIESIDTTIVKTLVDCGHIPVIASVAADKDGQAYNVNADTAAGEIAASLGAEKLILMTDVPGLMLDFHKPETLVRSVDIKGVRKLIDEGIVSGGMIPKVECCVRSLAQGVNATHIIDGRAPHSLLLEILTDEGKGTMITG
eukprot:SM000040S14867  [mRNA]  locus=s40:768799:773098:- [translate_table: standard]